MVYDEAGQLKTKYLHSQSNQAFLQKVDYRYNIRGWLSAINDPGLTGTESDQFGVNLYYNRSSSGAVGYFNGNIQGEKWGITSYLNQETAYSYDKLNRITASKFGTANSFRTSYSYDSNGNLSKLTRRGSTGAYIDSISYGYKYYTNQLDYTSDYYGDAPGWDFPGTLTGSNHYQYDAMGNLTRDDYKAVSVAYNSFNLPSELDFGNNQKLSYYYDGSGRKITKINTPGGYYPTNTEYRGQMVHQSSNGTSSLKYIITSEGRLLNTGTNAAPVWGWEYDLKDHLGNVRVIFKPNTTNNGVVRVEYANYFPFGMKMLAPYSTFSGAKYLYNGKEMQDDFGLNWYDYGARFYDPTIGRWHSVDPKAEFGRRWSPYAYGFDNPMMFLDPDGMWGLPYMEKMDRRYATNATPFVWNVAAEIYNGVAGTVNMISDAITDPSSVPSAAEMARGAAESLQNIDLSNPDTQEKIVAGAVTFAAGELLMAGKASGALKGAEAADNAVEITVSRSKFPHAAQHIDDAAANGVSTTGTIDRAGASSRRSAATRSTPTRSGMDRDEVPPAVINNGGNGSSVRHIDMKDNRGAGGSIGQQIKKLPDGTPVKIVTK